MAKAKSKPKTKKTKKSEGIISLDQLTLRNSGGMAIEITAKVDGALRRIGSVRRVNQLSKTGETLYKDLKDLKTEAKDIVSLADELYQKIKTKEDGFIAMIKKGKTKVTLASLYKGLDMSRDTAIRLADRFLMLGVIEEDFKGKDIAYKMYEEPKEVEEEEEE